MATTIQVKRGTTAQCDAVTPASGEPLWDTTLKILAVGDGSTAGGIAVAMGSSYVTKALYDAHSILYATTDDTPVALTVGASTIVGRKASGNISAMSAAETLAVLSGAAAAAFSWNSQNLTSVGTIGATSLATTAATPLLLTNGQLVNIALTSKTVGATTLTIPNFASVVDEFVFKTLAVTMSNKTFIAPVLGAATATSINGLTITTTAGTLTIANSASAALVTSGNFSITLTATAATNVTLPTTGTLATLAGAETFTAKLGYNGLVVTPNTGVITTGTWNGTTIAVANGGTGVTASTGTVAVVLSTTPTLVTPILGVASATSLATSAAIPLLLTYGQLVNIALTSQTVGATTLTIPNFASVVDTFAFITLSQTLVNKTLTSPTINGTIATTGLTFPAITLAGAVTGGDQAFTNVGDMTFAAGSILASGSTNGNTLLIAANDTTFITLTTGTTDVCTLNNITMSGTWLASGTVTLPAITLGGAISMAANDIVFTNGRIQSGSWPDYIDIRNTADNALGGLYCSTLACGQILTEAATGYLSAQNANASLLYFRARDTDVGPVVIGGLFGAADPYMGMGGPNGYDCVKATFAGLLGFFGTNPTTRPAHINNSAGDDATAVNAIIAALETLGLVASA